MSYYSSNIECQEDTMFGLPSKDLTEAQLKKIDIAKLFCLMKYDSRATKIALLKALDLDVNSTTVADLLINLKNFVSEDKEIIFCYNILVAKAEGSENANRYYYFHVKRNLNWDLLNYYNKRIHIKKWLNGDSSTAFSNKNLIEEDLLKIYSKEWVEEIFIKYFRSRHWCVTASVESLKNDGKIIESLSEDLIKEIKNIILDSSLLFHFLLKNKHIDDDDKEKIIRKMAGRKRLVGLRATINKEIILRLPPVMRLKFVEAVRSTGSYFEIEGVCTKTEFKELLFSTSLKYNDRVNVAVRSAHCNFMLSKGEDDE